MDSKIIGEVLRISLIGSAISIPLKYYLLKHHVDTPMQNAAIMVVWGLVTGHVLFSGSRERLKLQKT